MHVLLIHQAFAALDEPGGTRHHELANYLAGQGHQVTVIASPVSYLTGKAARPAKPPGTPRPEGVHASPANSEKNAGDAAVRVVRASTCGGLHRSFVHRVFSFVSFMLSSFWLGLGVRGVDVVWGTSPPIFQGATAWALARLKRAAFLFEVRDLWPAFAVAVGVLRDPALIWLAEGLERFLLRQAGWVVVNSPGFLAHVEARGAREVALIPNGADTRMFDPAAEGLAFRQAHGLEGAFVALYAGAHGLSNDLGVVVEAGALLRDLPQVRIVLLGDGKEKPALQARAVEMGLENVIFLPPVPKMEMPAALAAADACIGILKPVALYATVYPNKIFDYLAAGRPVVLAMEGVIREVVEAAGAGLPVSPGDPAALATALRTLAADPARSRAMGLAGRAYLEAHFDRAALAARLEAVLAALCPSRG